jgi:GntR family transcriptional regulator
MQEVSTDPALGTLDRSSFVPLYHQLFEILYAHIEQGIWKPDDMIPPESDLKAIYGVSQITVRQALNVLANSGLIVRRRGKGSFVTRPTISANVTHIVNFADDMKQRGLTPRTEVIDMEIAVVSKPTATKLHIEPGEELIVIKRLRYANDEPLSIEHSMLIPRQVPGIMNNDFSARSLSETLLTDYGIQISHAEQTIRAMAASEENAALLRINAGDPLLAIERVCYTQRGTPVEMLRIYYRADRYMVHAQLKAMPINLEA